MSTIYLDNSATTALCDEAKQAMLAAMECYGNPSSLHKAGLDAEHMVKKAREQVLSALGVRTNAGQVYFTSSGTEANNLAILGSAYAKERRVGGRIVTTEGEHSSVEMVLRDLEKKGFDVVRIPTRDGVLDMDFASKAITKDTLLVTTMMVNNETGALYDLKALFALAKRNAPGVVTHCDAVQGFMKTIFSPAAIGADMVTVSSHKIHGPKGVGALYVSAEVLKAKKLIPVTLGGGQEAGMRSGTENTIGIAGFGAACARAQSTLRDDLRRMSALRTYLEGKLAEIGEIKLNLPRAGRAPHIVNLTLPDIKSETMLHYLSGQGIYVSSGSACSSHGHATSRALSAFGLGAEQADCSLRVSLCPANTEGEIDALCAALGTGVRELVRIHK
ncbi:MAG: cysteine desulfurase [Clostridia bacterium]|nr:cysteine desulfurase [Clostridia bacterium]